MATTATTTETQDQIAKEVILDLKTKSIQVYSNGDDIRYRVTFDQSFDAIKKDLATEEYGIAQVDYIDFVPRVLIAQCINHIEGLDFMYTKKKETGLKGDNASGFGAAELQVVLRGAKLQVKRTQFNAGDEYTDGKGETQTHDNTGFNTDIVKIVVSDRVQANLDKMFDAVFA